MAHVASELSKLRDGSLSLSALVQTRSASRCTDKPCQYIARTKRHKCRESFIDTTFASAKGGSDGIGKTKRGKGVKIMGIVDRKGLQLVVCTHAANHHEVTLVQLTFDFYMIEAKPEKLIGDKAYDSDDLDDDLGKQGIDNDLAS